MFGPWAPKLLICVLSIGLLIMMFRAKTIHSMFFGKTHVKFVQDLDCLNFSSGNRSENQETHHKSNETIRKQLGTCWNIIKNTF